MSKLRFLRLFLISVAVILVGGLVYLIPYANQPISWSLSYSYSPYIFFSAYDLKNPDNEAVFTRATIGHSGWEMSAGIPLPESLNVTLYIKNEAIEVSEITKNTIASLGGRKIGAPTYDGDERWDIDEIGAFYFQDGNLYLISLYNAGISWDENEIINLPIAESALRRGWGEPDKENKRVMRTRWNRWTQIDL